MGEQDTHPTKLEQFLWNGRAGCPSDKTRTIGLGEQDAHPTKLEQFLWGGRPARPCNRLKTTFAKGLMIK